METENKINLIDAIHDTVMVKVANQETFTIRTILYEMRKLGYWHSAWTIEQVILDWYRMNHPWSFDYMVKHMNLGEKHLTAVFFHKDSDPFKWIDEQRNFVKPEEKPQPEEDITIIDSPVIEDVPLMFMITQVAAVDGKARLTKAILEYAGFHAGDKVGVNFEGCKAVVTPVIDVYSTPYTIDCKINLRINMKAHGINSNDFNVVAKPGQIVIS